MPAQAIQRLLTTEFIKKKRLNIPAIWLKADGIEPSAADAVADTLSTDLNDWTDERNMGVRLIDGHLELQIRAPDDVWAGCLFEACKYLVIDARASWGVNSVTSSILRI